MSLIHPGLLFGLALGIIPIVLHLMLRAKPKRVVFPAMRLIRERRQHNVKRMRLRHLWLLLLRILAICLLVFAIARPSLPAANYGLKWHEWGLLAAVAAGGIAGYRGLVHYYQKQGLAEHQMKYKRASLRSWAMLGTLIGLIAIVGWPYQRRIAAEIKGPPAQRDLNLPVAGVFLFDTSMGMSYLQTGETRLDVAKRMAREHLRSLPADSRIAVTDTSHDVPVLFQANMSAAKARIESLEPKAASLPLNDRILAALQLQRDEREKQSLDGGGKAKDNAIRRIYVFTDLAKNGWSSSPLQQLITELGEQEMVKLNLIDVGEEKPINLGISQLQLSRQRIPAGGTVELKTTLSAVGMPNEEKQIKVYVRDARNQPVEMGRANWKPEGTTLKQFTLVKLNGPIVHGEVRLISSDPFAADDVRYFTLEARVPPKVLVVAPTLQEADTWMLALASDPSTARYQPEFKTPREAEEITLAEYDAVCLINVPKMPDREWVRLGEYVEGGGGLFVVVGSTELEAISYSRAEAQKFLPAQLDAWKPKKLYHLQFPESSHPIYRGLVAYDAITLLQAKNVYRFWHVVPAEGATVVARYDDPQGSPAIAERIHGRGRTVMFTTNVDLSEQRNRWNDLPSFQDSWTYIALADMLMQHVSRNTDVEFNFTPGDSVKLFVEPTNQERNYLLSKPGLEQLPQTVPALASEVTVADARQVGHYDLIPNQPNSQPAAGFSMNMRPEESDFSRFDTKELDAHLGEGRYQVARSLTELKDQINIADLGVEVFPMVLAILLFVFCGEMLIANWFYDEQGGTTGNSGEVSVPSKSPSAPRSLPEAKPVAV